jgi:hypothetical protein
MSATVFELNVKVNGVEQTISTVAGLEQALVDTKNQLAGLEVGTREFKSLETQASNLEKVLGALQTDTDKFTSSIKQTTQATDRMADALTQTAEAATALDGKSIKEVGSETEKFTTKAQSARAELRKITQELFNLEPGSARFKELSLRAGELRDQMGDTSAIIGVVAGNATERFGTSLELALTQGIVGLQGLQQGFQAAGFENEQLNKTLGVLQGILGAASLIKFAGGLPDILDQVKAGFGSVLGPLRSYISGLIASTVATEGATVATTALAVAQNALPLILILTGIVLVTNAIISYVSASSEAEKQDEIRQKQLDEQVKKYGQLQEKTTAEIGNFRLLASQLKETNAGSKRRSELITEINSKYGTTLQNLTDEKKFQEQLNIAVTDFIALQKTRFKIEASKVDSLNLYKEEEQLAKDRLRADQNYNNFVKNVKDPTSKQFYDKEKERLKGNVDAIKKNQEENTKAIQKQAEDQLNFYETERKLLEKSFNGKKDQVKGNKDVASSYDKVGAKIEEWAKRADDAETKLAESRRTRNRTETEQISYQLDLELANIIKVYEQDKKYIEENLKDKRKQKDEIAKIEADKNRVVLSLTTIAAQQIEKVNDDYLKSEKELLAGLKLGREVLNKEVTFGNQNTSDLILAQDTELLRSQLSLVESQISQTSALELGAQQKLGKERLELREQIAVNEAQIAEQGARTEATLQRTEILNYYDSLSQIIVEYNEKTNKLTVKIDEEEKKRRIESLQEEIRERKKAGEDEITLQEDFDVKKLEIEQSFKDIRLQSEEFLLKQIENLNLESNAKVEASSIDYINKITQLSEESQNQQESNLFEFIKNVEKITSESFGVISNLFSEIDNIRQTDQELINQQAERDLQKLQNTYALQKDLETRRYNEGLISKAQYNESIEALDNQLDAQTKVFNDNLIDQQNAVAEKTFKTQKALRISQTIISGIQGALDAYASAQSLPFGAGIIVGPILAAAVAATTAIAVRNIAKTQFNPRQTSSSSAGFSSSSPNIPQIGGGSQFNQNGGFTSFNTQNIGTQNNQTDSQTNGQEGSSQKVYVLESDISETQRRVRILEGQSTFN